MPTYRSINVELHSQFDVETLPEYAPQPQSYYESQGISDKVPASIDDETSTRSVYVPVLPGSQFWISYAVSQPISADQHFLFKLFINGAHITSWSSGKNEGWKGKTMFALYEREDAEGKKMVEKRALRFTPPDQDDGEWKDVINAFDEEAYLEIRIHRAHDRKRIGREFEQYEKTAHSSRRRGIELFEAGRAGGSVPKRFYKFALVDPIDQPFASFRYYYRTWEQIHELGLLERRSDVHTLPFTEGADPEKKIRESGGLRGGELDDVFATVSLRDDDQAPTSLPRAYVPTVSAMPNVTLVGQRPHSAVDNRHNGAHTPPRFYRLSVPPSLKLEPPKRLSREHSSIPQKNNPDSTTGYHPHPAYPVEEWVVRTPSPVRSIRESISTPPLGKRRGFMATSLINVVANAWKRRGTLGSEMSNEAGNHRDVL